MLAKNHPSTTQAQRNAASNVASVDGSNHFPCGSQCPVKLASQKKPYGELCSSVCAALACAGVACAAVACAAVACAAVVCAAVVCEAAVCEAVVCGSVVCGARGCHRSLW